MTVLEATNRLVQFFAQNDSFEIGTDMSKIVPVFDSNAFPAAILIALENLEKQEFIAKKEVEGKEFWVLLRPLAMQEQHVRISLLTAVALAETVNAFDNPEKERATPVAITEKDIAYLIALVKTLSNAISH